MYRSLGKRVLDLILSLIACILLAPVMLVTATLIKLFDPGPVIFRQIRVGQDNAPFTLLKFRSMPVGTAQLSSDKVSLPSLSWVGQLIRRTNVDELPQLINILLGEMSVVGPRPALPDQTTLVQERKVNGADQCRPGLTGLAQISAYDGMSAAEKARWDGVYCKSVSLANDVLIIAKTSVYLTRRPPTY